MAFDRTAGGHATAIEHDLIAAGISVAIIAVDAGLIVGDKNGQALTGAPISGEFVDAG